MRVNVALFASLSDYHTVGGEGRTREYDIRDGCPIREVIELLGLPDQPRIVFVDGRHADEDRALQEGERLAIFPPVAGG